ncbi:MAG TPA: hypothetical protein VGS61_05220 [Acidimicrobiales bacterium]|nr:hypothetical protein [Acidimicrobiales bacterium]
MTATAATVVGQAPDRRGSWIPNGSMIKTRILELRKRRGLMIALLVVDVGIPAIFLTVRLIAHAVAPKSYGPAGGYDIFNILVIAFLYVFSFIVAATVGASAGSNDLTEGMFRHLVVTGRSRLAIYFARIPAGLAIVGSIVAAGFTIVCLVCSFAAPTTLKYEGTAVPTGLTLTGFEQWAEGHVNKAICQLPNRNIPIPCGPHGVIYNKNGSVQIFKRGPNGPITTSISRAQLETFAKDVAIQDYSAYKKVFLSPPISVMVQTGLWIELEAAIGFIVGLGLSSLIGQRTITTVLLIILQVILTPLFLVHPITHLINAERSIVGVAMAHIEPNALHVLGGGGGGGPGGGPTMIPEATSWSIVVIVAWIVVWTGLGAWRMATRDA